MKGARIGPRGVVSSCARFCLFWSRSQPPPLKMESVEPHGPGPPGQSPGLLPKTVYGSTISLDRNSSTTLARLLRVTSIMRHQLLVDTMTLACKSSPGGQCHAAELINIRDAPLGASFSLFSSASLFRTVFHSLTFRGHSFFHFTLSNFTV